MEEWQKRVMTECLELDTRLKKLESFINNDINFKHLNLYEQQRLRDQHYHMSGYSKILHERMIHFEI